VTKPQPLEHVSSPYTATGINSNIPTNTTIWVVVQYQSFLWPEAALPAGATAWSQDVYIGNPNTKGWTFTLLVVEADSFADQTFHEWGRTNNGPTPAALSGSQYPAAHVVVLASVNVVLQ
jgi:hypothetical protein